MTNERVALYFGPNKFRKEHEAQVPTPTGQLCLHCDEAIQDGDTGTYQAYVSEAGTELKPVHHECTLRMVVGSLGHQQRRCSCFGGTEEDPEGMTKHEAAIAAARHFYAKERF